MGIYERWWIYLKDGISHPWVSTLPIWSILWYSSFTPPLCITTSESYTLPSVTETSLLPCSHQSVMYGSELLSDGASSVSLSFFYLNPCCSISSELTHSCPSSNACHQAQLSLLIEPTSHSLPCYVVTLHRCFMMWILKWWQQCIHVAIHLGLNEDLKLLIWGDRAGVDVSIESLRKQCADRCRKQPPTWGEYRLHKGLWLGVSWDGTNGAWEWINLFDQRDKQRSLWQEMQTRQFSPITTAFRWYSGHKTISAQHPTCISSEQQDLHSPIYISIQLFHIKHDRRTLLCFPLWSQEWCIFPVRRV